jgi:hypothetical protein
MDRALEEPLCPKAEGLLRKLFASSKDIAGGWLVTPQELAACVTRSVGAMAQILRNPN